MLIRAPACSFWKMDPRRFGATLFRAIMVAASFALCPGSARADDVAVSAETEQTTATQPDASAGPKYYKHLFALCVGINKYESDGIPSLQYAENDAQDMTKVLRERFGFDVKLLVGPDATRAQLESELAALMDTNRVGSEDGVLFYFSGHGQTVPTAEGEQGYLIPYDAKLRLDDLNNPAPFRRFAIRMDDLRADADAIPARHVLFLVDACYSGYAASTKGLEVMPEIRAALAYRARQVITAGTRGEEAVENSAWGHGAFTYKVLELLRAEDRAIAASELGAELKKRVPRAVAERLPGRILSPQVRYLSGEGDFVFLPKSADLKALENSLSRPSVLSPARVRAVIAEAVGYYSGTTGRVDEKRARQLFLETETTSDPLALMWLARLYTAGRCGVTHDSPKARHYAIAALPEIRRMAEANDPDACFLLASAFEEGLGLPTNTTQAFTQYRRSVDAGSVIALANLAGMYLNGRGTPKDFSAAKTNYEKAAALGNAKAMERLGDIYRRGNGVKKDLDQAMSWWRRAAQLGDAEAMFSLASAYAEDSESRDCDLARMWFERAALAGQSWGWYEIGRLLKNGTCGTTDTKRALEFFHKSATDGNCCANTMVGDMLWERDHNAHDTYSWYLKGAITGCGRAIYGIRELAKKSELPRREIQPLLDAEEKQAEEVGDTNRLVGLARVYEEAAGIERDDAHAVRLYRKAAEAGNQNAMAKLGIALWTGDGVTTDTELAEQWFEKASSEGGSEALGAVARSILEKVPDLGVKLLKRVAESGDSQAMADLANAYSNGTGVTKSEHEALAWHRRAASSGESDSMRQIGVAYEFGTGVEKNPEQAVQWYRKAADAGDAAGMTSLGYMYENGRGIDKSEQLAVELYRKGADAGDAAGMNSLGVMYEIGRGVEKNEQTAVEWYRRAAEAGDARGMTNLGRAYEFGTGIGKSESEAVSWYRKSAEAGFANGMFNLADMYENGKGIQKSYEQALIWYRKSADEGEVSAMTSLGRMYENGLGVEKHSDTAIEWYRKAVAANADDETARTSLQRLEADSKTETASKREAKRK